LEQIELEESFTQRVLKPLVLRVVAATGRFLPNKRLARVRQRLQLAGEPGGLTPAQFYGIQIWLTFITGALAALRLHFGEPPTRMLLLELVVFVVVGFKLPDIWLSRRIKQRQLALTNSLPDALDMLTIAVEAGLSFDQGLGEIVARWKNELSREFQRVLYEIGMGTSRREALEHFRDRTGVSDITTFVVAINHAEEMGSGMGHVLNVQSQEMRTRRRQRAQEKANKVPVKMMFPLVFFIFPSMFAVILGPAIPRIMHAMAGVH
jgi:tight adherence protein C